MDLFQCDFVQLIWCVGPMERIAVQPFHQDPKSRPVPLENFDQCASAVAEGEHTAGIRVKMEFQLDDCRQTGVALAKVCYTARQIDGCVSREVKHSSSEPGAERLLVWRDSLPPVQSGYFPEDR